MKKKKNELRPIDKPIYGYWQALYLSFFSSRLYVDIGKRWRGFGIRYLLLVIAIAAIPLSVRIILNFNQYFNEQLLMPVKSLPPLYVQNGEISLDKPMPYFIKNKEGNVVGIVDTTGNIKEMGPEYPHLALLVTKNKIFFHAPVPRFYFNKPLPQASFSVYEQSINKNTNEVFVGKDWIKSSNILQIKLLGEALVYPIIMMFFFSLYIVAVLTLGFLGQLFAQIFFSFKLKFKQAIRLFVVACTPQIFLFFIILTTNTAFPGVGFIYLVLLAIYFSYAVLSLKRESKKMVVS